MKAKKSVKKTVKKSVKKSVKKPWEVNLFIFSDWSVKQALKEKGIYLNRKDLDLFLDYLKCCIYESLDDKIEDIENESYEVLEDAVNDLNKELKKPESERDILSYL